MAQALGNEGNVDVIALKHSRIAVARDIACQIIDPDSSADHFEMLVELLREPPFARHREFRIRGVFDQIEDVVVRQRFVPPSVDNLLHVVGDGSSDKLGVLGRPFRLFPDEQNFAVGNVAVFE